MDYLCSVCKRRVQGDLIIFKDHTENHIIDLVKHDHPDWVEKDGICKECLEYYRSEINGSVLKDAACAVRMRKSKSIWNSIRGLFKKV